MARQNHGPLSRAKGKLGGVVYQQYEGMQVAREYQPVVKNPQTKKQTENRASFKLASQITAEFFYTLNTRLAKSSIYTRIRRGIAVRNLKFVVDNTTPETPQVLVDAAIASINAASVSGIPGPTLSTLSGQTATITATSGDTVVYTVVQYGSGGKAISIENETYTSDGTAKQIDVLTATGAEAGICMAVAYHALTEAGRALITNILGDETGWSLGIIRGIAAGDIEVTNLSGRAYNS